MTSDEKHRIDPSGGNKKGFVPGALTFLERREFTYWQHSRSHLGEALLHSLKRDGYFLTLSVRHVKDVSGHGKIRYRGHAVYEVTMLDPVTRETFFFDAILGAKGTEP